MTTELLNVAHVTWSLGDVDSALGVERGVFGWPLGDGHAYPPPRASLDPLFRPLECRSAHRQPGAPPAGFYENAFADRTPPDGPSKGHSCRP